MRGDFVSSLRLCFPACFVHVLAQDFVSLRRLSSTLGSRFVTFSSLFVNVWLTHVVVKTFNRLRRTFDAIDDDESGEIERKEFRKLIKRLAPQMSTEEGDEVFNSIDVPTPGIHSGPSAHHVWACL